MSGPVADSGAGSAPGAQPMPVPPVSGWVVSYVVLSPDGLLQVRSVGGGAVAEDRGARYQAMVRALVCRDVDPYRGTVHGVDLPAGLRATVADRAGSVPRLYPLNPVASAVLTTLGHPPRRWWGTIALVGTEGENGPTAPLTVHQFTVISKAHRLASATPGRTGLTYCWSPCRSPSREGALTHGR